MNVENTEFNVQSILKMVEALGEEDRYLIFEKLRSEIKIHQIETDLNIAGEIILEAIHKNKVGLIYRMIRGVIGEAAFGIEVVKKLDNWVDITPAGDPPYDYLLKRNDVEISVQVKLQRSVLGSPMVAKTANKTFSSEKYVVETQKTRGGLSKQDKKSTRDYKFGEFDILAVSLQPATNSWNTFMYTVSRWLIPNSTDKNRIFKYQPISKKRDSDWTDNFEECAAWFESNENKTIAP